MDLLLSATYYRTRRESASTDPGRPPKKPTPVLPIPKVALVGRPNVGKSTLFNRICGRRRAITDSRPGSTRDRNYAQCNWTGKAFELVDTGGLLLASKDPLLGPATAQAERAIAESDLVIFVVDARAGLLPDDESIAQKLRRGGRNTLVAVNKVEGEEPEGEFEPLGFEQLPISAEHGLGVGDLLDAACHRLPQVDEPEAIDALRIAIIGRPNVGKSSLLNRLLGAERAVVSKVPGTTRDAVDAPLTKGDRRYLFVDTAGIRKIRLLTENVDHVSVVQARRALARAEIAILVVDLEAGVREMDATIAGYAHAAGRGVVIAINKWDRAMALGIERKTFEQDLRDNLKFLSFAPIVTTSALSGRGLERLLQTADRISVAQRERVSTGLLNRVIARAVKAQTPRHAKGSRPVSILYATQVGVAPPTFLIATNQPGDLHFSYRRYLENQLRREFGFEGTPLVLKVRGKRRRS